MQGPAIADSTSGDPVGTVLAGRYRIEALIGAGGMGAVYRAEHVHMRKTVAVKILHREMTQMPEVVARFEREAVAAARITHPNVAAATDFGRLDDGSFYLALEFIEGRSLAKLIKDEGALPERRALELARQIADALAAAHAAGVVHRDLKPDNVMLVDRAGSHSFVKVLDFGIAKIRLEATGDQPLTQMGTVFGTPEYMSPEQAQGLEVDARADLYTLGVMLYEMLTGTSPFRHEDLVVVLTRQITMDVPRLPDSISSTTAELVQRLLQKSPAQRVASAAELREQIDEILSSKVSSGVVAVAASSPRAAAQRASAGDEAATGRTALSFELARRDPWSTLRAWVARIQLSRRFRIGRYAMPLGAALGLSGLLAVGLGLVVFLLLVSGGGSEGSGSKEPEKPEEPEILALVAKAEAGDATAIAELAARPAGKRTTVEWRAIAHGYCLLDNYKACLGVYQEGVVARSELASDSILLADVRRAGERQEVSNDALEFAARSLGSAGADLLYDVIEKGKASTPSVARARALLEQEPAKSRVSPALAAAQRLSGAMKKPKCAELKALLPELADSADERSVATLTRLNDRRGCGFFGLSDCYGCLRSGGELGKVLEGARSRPRPSFGQPAPAPSAAPARSVAPKTAPAPR